MRNRFGRVSEQFFTWVQIPSGLLYAGLWLQGLAVFVAAAFDIPLELTIVVTGSVVILMALLGGSWSVMAGDFVQTLVLTIYLLWRAPGILRKILGLWKPSMFAGFMGAFASQFWFLAFALTAAANVRTLALVEVLFAQGVAYYSFKQPVSARELLGIVLIVIGVALLVAA